MVFRLLNEPATRFGSEDAAKEWLRKITSDYLKSKGISVNIATTNTSNNSVISSAQLEKISAKQNGLFRKQLELLTSYLGDEKNGQVKAVLEEVKLLQSELDLWSIEHGGVTYAEGIRPIFSAAKARRYDSWWNWARQEVARAVLMGEQVDERMLANRADKQLVEFLEWHSYQRRIITRIEGAIDQPSVYDPTFEITKPSTTICDAGKISYKEVSRNQSLSDYVKTMFEKKWLHLRSTRQEEPSQWEYNAQLTKVYEQSMQALLNGSSSFCGRNVLMTGCGRGSIGVEMLKCFLEGGAQVIVTTSSYNKANLDTFREVYEKHGSKGSALVLVPFNQASTQDITQLINYIYNALQWDLDTIVPFAAMSENGKSLLDLEDGKAELAHRMMLTNVLRLIGHVVRTKEALGIKTRPAQVILPLSPNHGVFGYDGLYGESKIGLETLFNRWYSESWSDYIGIVGAVIGYSIISFMIS